MHVPIGIDLGTTNSVVASCDQAGRARIIPNLEGDSTTPSVVAFPASGGQLFGSHAAQLLRHGLAPGAELFKRWMGRDSVAVHNDGVDYTPEHLSALLLRHLVDAAETNLGERPSHAVVTVPAYFENAEREATLRAVEMAGLSCLQLINEPTAAAIAHLADTADRERRVLVYDLGGGTFDVTILQTGSESRVLTSLGDHNLGGADWDQELVLHLIDQLGAADQHGITPFDRVTLDDRSFRVELRGIVQKLKADLSVLPRSHAQVRHGNQTAVVSVDRVTFERRTEGLIQATLELTRDALAEASLTTGDVDEVLLVGGSTRMPAVRNALERMFSRRPLATLHPDEAVALGAALKADALARELGLAASPLGTSSPARFAASIDDITNHSLGMIAIDKTANRYVNRTMIRRSTPLPALESQHFTHAFQSGAEAALEVFVTQGESEDPQMVEYLGRYLLRSLPGIPLDTRRRIEIAFRYDLSGLVGVQARADQTASWVDLDREPPPADVPARFDEAPPRPARALEVLLCFDVSASMAGEPITRAREAAAAFVAQMNLSKSRVGIEVVADRSKVILAPCSDSEQIDAAIQQIDVNYSGVGYSNKGHPFKDVKRTLRGSNVTRAAVVLADGVWHCQPAAIKASEACRSHGIKIVAIGFGHAEESFLNAISSDRDLSILTSADGLAQAFTTIAHLINERAGLSTQR